MANWLQLLGTISGFIGALLMVKEIVIVDKTTGTVGWLSKSKENANRNKLWTLWGLGFVALGFILQSWSTYIDMKG